MTELRPIPHGLLQAFRAFDSARGAGDGDTLDRYYVDSPTTLRGDRDGLLVGHDAIAAHHARAAERRYSIVQTHVQVIDDDHALVMAVTESPIGVRGLQTQLWVRSPEHGWQVSAAHLS